MYSNITGTEAQCVAYNGRWFSRAKAGAADGNGARIAGYRTSHALHEYLKSI